MIGSKDQQDEINNTQRVGDGIHDRRLAYLHHVQTSHLRSRASENETIHDETIVSEKSPPYKHALASVNAGTRSGERTMRPTFGTYHSCLDGVYSKLSSLGSWNWRMKMLPPG